MTADPEPEYDWVVVDRLLRGIPVEARRADIDETIRRMHKGGMINVDIQQALHVSAAHVRRVVGGAVGHRAPIKHGTEYGFKAHRLRGEDPCDVCRRAHNERERLRYQRRVELNGRGRAPQVRRARRKECMEGIGGE